MTTLIFIKEKKKKTKPVAPPEEKMFNKLKKQIEKLHKDFDNHTRELDTLVSFYQSAIENPKQELASALQKEAKLIYRHYSNKQEFSKDERDILKKNLLHLLEKISQVLPLQYADKEIVSIFDELHNINREQLNAKAANEFKEYLEDLEKSELDEDFDEANEGKSFFDGIFDFLEDLEENPFKQKTSSPQRQKEIEAEEVKQKAMRTIYKQLAKALHPDLEQNPLLKKEKEVLMKELTLAYENNDLHSLLNLEKKHNQKNTKNKENLFVTYNEIFKEQIKKLKISIKSIPMDPKYSSIHIFLNYGIHTAEKIILEQQEFLRQEVLTHQKRITQLESAEAVALIKKILSPEQKSPYRKPKGRR